MKLLSGNMGSCEFFVNDLIAVGFGMAGVGVVREVPRWFKEKWRRWLWNKSVEGGDTGTVRAMGVLYDVAAIGKYRGRHIEEVMAEPVQYLVVLQGKRDWGLGCIEETEEGFKLGVGGVYRNHYGSTFLNRSGTGRVLCAGFDMCNAANRYWSKEIEHGSITKREVAWLMRGLPWV